ncbi:hypothetical protein ACA910_008025 [Epithemia clementina (nom. ined.)]
MNPSPSNLVHASALLDSYELTRSPSFGNVQEHNHHHLPHTAQCNHQHDHRTSPPASSTTTTTTWQSLWNNGGTMIITTTKKDELYFFPVSIFAETIGRLVSLSAGGNGNVYYYCDYYSSTSAPDD